MQCRRVHRPRRSAPPWSFLWMRTPSVQHWSTQRQPRRGRRGATPMQRQRHSCDQEPVTTSAHCRSQRRHVLPVEHAPEIQQVCREAIEIVSTRVVLFEDADTYRDDDLSD